jgi:hypothetical protein
MKSSAASLLKGKNSSTEKEGTLEAFVSANNASQIGW